MANKQLLVCDLDNTLYDWVGYFVPAFYAMVDQAIAITGANRERLLNDFRQVHQSVKDSEHPFSLLLTETIKEQFEKVPRAEVTRALDPAFYAFNSMRKQRLSLYPGVIEGLDRIREAGIILVAHTESKTPGVVDRMRRLNLFPYFNRVYCRERTTSEVTSGLDANWFNDAPIEKITELKDHQGKPNPDILKEICSNEGVANLDAAYVGDSLYKDVLMANDAHVMSIWAKYGTAHEVGFYEKLVRVSHWTEDEIENERRERAAIGTIEPDFTASESFSEVADVLGC